MFKQKEWKKEEVSGTHRKLKSTIYTFLSQSYYSNHYIFGVLLKQDYTPIHNTPELILFI